MIPQKSRKEIEILGIICCGLGDKNDMATTTEASQRLRKGPKTLRLHTLFKWNNPGWVTSHGKEIVPKGKKTFTNWWRVKNCRKYIYSTANQSLWFVAGIKTFLASSILS